MKVLVVDNVHLIKDEEGEFYSPSIYSYNFFHRYLEVFDEVRIVGKLIETHSYDISKLNKISGPGIEVVTLPWYKGLKQGLKKMPELIPIYRNICQDCDCYVFRMAQIESLMAYFIGKTGKKPFAIEVVNDPGNSRDLISAISLSGLRHMIKKANGVSYVTKEFLQAKYPHNISNPARFNAYYSSVELNESDIANEPKTFCGENVLKIVHVSNSISSDQKGHTTLLKALKFVIEKGYNVEAHFIGDGPLLEHYKQMASDFGIAENVKFVGRINTKDAVLEYMKKCDLMVLPTQAEGLPRTIIEAMAVGLPCLSTGIAGIPELLGKEYLFDPFDYEGFANKIISLINSPEKMNQMSEENLKKSRGYTVSVLQKRRFAFYSKLRKVVEQNVM